MDDLQFGNIPSETVLRNFRHFSCWTDWKDFMILSLRVLMCPSVDKLTQYDIKDNK